jgi:hypothetical protein
MSGVDTAHAASFVDSEMAGVNSPPFINGAAAASEAFDRLLAEVRACTLCAPHLPLGPRPVLRGRPSARLLIISQAPGARVHETGLSFNDRSGDRLREWLALDREIFYDESRVAIMPIGLCYPGGATRGGDLPPRRECAPRWHPPVRAVFPAIELTLLVGSVSGSTTPIRAASLLMWRTGSASRTGYRPKGSNDEVEAHHCRPGRGVCPRLVVAAAIRGRRPGPRGGATHDVAATPPAA